MEDRITNMKLKNGFTLVEALALMAIAAIILAASMPIITKKHLRAPLEGVKHGRFECWWEGNILKQRMISEGRIVTSETRDHPAWTSGTLPTCTFNPPQNVDKFSIYAVGGGGAGGGAGGGFINSKLVANEGPTRNSYFQPVIVNGSPAANQYSAGWGDPDVMIHGDPWPTWPNWPLVTTSGVAAKRGGFVADGELRKLGHSRKQVGTQWFKWSYLQYGTTGTTNSQAYQYIGVVCSGAGGKAGNSVQINDDVSAFAVLKGKNRKHKTAITNCLMLKIIIK